jgi:hypothetical protein
VFTKALKTIDVIIKKSLVFFHKHNVGMYPSLEEKGTCSLMHISKFGIVGETVMRPARG